MRAPTVAFVIALGAGLLTGAGTAQVGAHAPGVGRPAAAHQKAKAPGRRISVVQARSVRPQSITATGQEHTCGLDEVGKAWCWGNSSQGQLGNGRHNWGAEGTSPPGNLDGPFKGTPVAVVGGHKFAAVTASQELPGANSFTCGLDDAGQAWCWGHGGNGKLGDGDLSDHGTGTPVAVLGGHSFTWLTAGSAHTCGLDREGKAWCWGAGYSGTPVAIGGGHTFTSLTSDWGGGTCGVARTGKAWCWDSGSRESPGAVAGSHRFTSLAHGGDHMCGLDGAGKAWCWGWGTRGLLGDGKNREHYRDRPVAVVGGHRFTSLTASSSHTCGVAKTGKAWCWGGGYGGRLGDGDTSRHFTATPVKVTGGHRFTSLSAGILCTCGIAKTGEAWCWGRGGYGRLGDGITRGHWTGTPVAVVGGHTFALP